MNAIKTMWCVALSPFAALAWMLLYALIFLGWGTERSDRFVEMWAKYVDEGDFRYPDGSSG